MTRTVILSAAKNLIPKLRPLLALLVVAGCAGNCIAQQPSQPAQQEAKPQQAPSPQQDRQSQQPAQGPQQEQRWFEVRADRLRYQPDARTMTASGNVSASYQEFEVRADQMQADLQARTAQFPGAVALVWRGERFEGKDLVVNLNTREWVLREVHSSVSPQFFQQGVVQPIIIGTVEAEGSPSAIRAGTSYATTCDLAHPHYRLQAREIRIRPGRDLVARHVSFWLGNRRVLSVPSFWVSLKERTRQPFFPQVGQSELEGSFIKTRTEYSLSSRSYGAFLLDAMSRRGLGQGIEHFYSIGPGQGKLRLYHVINPQTDLREMSGALAHEQPLGQRAKFSLAAETRRNAAWYLGTSTLSSLRGALDFRAGDSTSSLSFGYNLSKSGLSGSPATRFGQWDAALRHDQPGLSLAAEFQRNTTAPGEADDEELNSRLSLARKWRQADLTLDVSRRFDIDGSRYTGDDFYQVQDRLPELALDTTAARLGINALRALPSRLNLSVGNFHEQPTNLTAYRANLLWEASPKEVRLSPSANLLIASALRQAFYGDKDHTAQYAYRLDTGIQQRFGSASLRIDYHLLEPKGFTPFRFDFISPYRVASAALDVQGKRSKASLLSGFDVENSRWQDILFRSQFSAGSRLKMGLSAGYDPNEGKWRDAVLQARWARGNDLLGLAARYDARRGKLRRLAADADVTAAKRWRVRYFVGYDNMQGRFIYNEVLLTRDLHCWEAILFYSQQRKIVRLDLRIKAFEWGGRDFGVGRFGQRIDSTLPDIY
jgi:hypothetical protein